LMREVVFDTETDGLLDEVTKIHVLSARMPDGEIVSTNDYEVMEDILTQPDTLYICHNVIRYDMPMLNIILDLNLKFSLFADTLALSWALFPDRIKHGLDELGKEHGVEKPKVDDWKGLTYEDYKHRCEEDVKINYLEWCKQKRRLVELYGT